MIDAAILQLVNYGIKRGLVAPEDKVYSVNRILEILGKSDCDFGVETGDKFSVSAVLNEICDYAERKGIIGKSTAERDLLDTAVMGCITPPPSGVIKKFNELYSRSPKEATDGYYRFCQETNYIRLDRIARDEKWKVNTEYGELDITINLSKPEKDPKAIAAAKSKPQTDYPKCQLCRENEGFAGDLTHPARQNHRIIPIALNGEQWYFQYSPYVYYNEHCIVLNEKHIPMKIQDATFRRLLDFITMFPHYFLGSNADLPIVGGSILSHDHFQGGNYTFAMAEAPVEKEIVFRGYPDISAGMVRWPMSVIRLRCSDPDRLVNLADKILLDWRGYTDETAVILAETNGVPHNTVTPIARRRGDDYELDLVLRNNLTTDEHPLGLYHPHANLHHIKKENIGLIEVMGLAVLPARLKDEINRLAQVIISGGNPADDKDLAKHAEWARDVVKRRNPNPGNIHEILKEEIGFVFLNVLEDAGVYKRNADGTSAFERFIDFVNRQ